MTVVRRLRRSLRTRILRLRFWAGPGLKRAGAADPVRAGPTTAGPPGAQSGARTHKGDEIRKSRAVLERRRRGPFTTNFIWPAVDPKSHAALK